MLRLFLYLLIVLVPNGLCAQQQVVYAVGKTPIQIIDNNFLALLSLRFVQQLCYQETIAPIANAGSKCLNYQLAQHEKQARFAYFKAEMESIRIVFANDQARKQEAIEKLKKRLNTESRTSALATQNSQDPYLASWISSKLNWKLAKLRCKRLLLTTRFAALTALLAVAYLVSRKIPQNSSLYPVESQFEWVVTWLSPYLINVIINKMVMNYLPHLSDPLKAKQHPYKTMAKKASISLFISLLQYFTYIQTSSYFHPYIMPTQQEYIRDFTQNMLCSNLLSIL